MLNAFQRYMKFGAEVDFIRGLEAEVTVRGYVAFVEMPREADTAEDRAKVVAYINHHLDRQEQAPVNEIRFVWVSRLMSKYRAETLCQVLHASSMWAETAEDYAVKQVSENGYKVQFIGPKFPRVSLVELDAFTEGVLHMITHQLSQPAN